MKALEARMFIRAAGRRAMTTIDERAERAAFAEQALGMVNGGFLSLMLSIGHRTGLLDTMATLPASTSSDIAAAAGLHERYVREWLGAMVTGRIVAYDPAAGTYRLPPPHGASLTRAAGPDNLAELAQLVAILGAVESDIVDVFRRGGGLGYEVFHRLHDWMSESSRTTLEATLLSRTLPQVPGLVDALRAGIDVLDVGCGRGEAVVLMAEAFPASRFVGLDLAADAVAFAAAQAERRRLTNARFVRQDAATLDQPSRYDFITTFDGIHDQAAPRTVLRRIREALRPRGTYLMVDVAMASHLEGNLDNPLAPLLFTISTMHCTCVSLGAGGEGLGACWGEAKARELLAGAGFGSIAMFQVEGDPLNLYYRCA
jgi:SAM-dependent methyltransferase